MTPRLPLAAVLACALALPAVAGAQTQPTTTAPADQTVTTPEEIGQDFGDEPAEAAPAPAAPVPLPVTGWRGRYALALGALLLGAGIGLRRLVSAR